MALVVFVLLKRAIGKKHTVEEVLLTMRNLKCKVYDSEILIQELTKQQKELVEKLGIIMPKKWEFKIFIQSPIPRLDLSC
jgi:hypothetical protein